MALTGKPTVRLSEVRGCHDCMAGAGDRPGLARRHGGTDGRPVCRVEPERRVSEAEYFGRGDRYPVTVFSTLGGGSMTPAEAAAALAGFDPRKQFDGIGGESELIRRLTAAGYLVS